MTRFSLRTRLVAVVVALAVSALSGCGLGAREDAAAEVAERFHSALADDDTAAACEVLAPATRDELEQS